MSKSKDSGVVTRPAATPRSPNRKPRHRTPLADYLRDHEWEQFLALCALEGDSEAYDKLTTPCDDKVRGSKIANTRGRIWYYVNMHGEKERHKRASLWADAKGRFAESLEERKPGMTAKATDIVDACLDPTFTELKPLFEMWEKTKDPEDKAQLAVNIARLLAKLNYMALDAAKAQLKGVGYWSDKQKLEHTGAEGQPLPTPTFYFVMPDGTKQTAKERMDARSNTSPPDK